MKVLQRPLLVVFACSSVLLHSVGADESFGSHVKDNFTSSQCLKVIDEVKKSGHYTEQSILPACEQEWGSPKCDFFAEALSLAGPRKDFEPGLFCSHMEQARFCSYSMDRLLMSQPVEDLSYGECLRAKKSKKLKLGKYCRKFQKMFSYAVTSGDLDTMRACYMIEAYTNLTGSQEPKTSKVRVIKSSGKELRPNASNATHHFDGRPDIVVAPKPLKSVGVGNGSVAGTAVENPKARSISKLKRDAKSAVNAKSDVNAAATSSSRGSIVTAPIPLNALAVHSVIKGAAKRKMRAMDAARTGGYVVLGNQKKQQHIQTKSMGVAKKEVSDSKQERKKMQTSEIANKPTHGKQEHAQMKKSEMVHKEALETNSTLETLNLRNNQISDASALAKAAPAAHAKQQPTGSLAVPARSTTVVQTKLAVAASTQPTGSLAAPARSTTVVQTKLAVAASTHAGPVPVKTAQPAPRVLRLEQSQKKLIAGQRLDGKAASRQSKQRLDVAEQTADKKKQANGYEGFLSKFVN